NTVYQLLAMRLGGDPQLEAADRLLLMPALLGAWLCGVGVNELTDATTTGCYDPAGGTWAVGLLDRARAAGRPLAGGARPGTGEGGRLRPEVDAGAARVVATASHDTAAAVVAVPFATGQGAAYVSSGTWSLVGVEVPRPVLGPAALAANLTNEAGVAGTWRLL